VSLAVPELDSAFYEKLKVAKKSQDSKSNIDPAEKNATSTTLQGS
jgi:hypothetical protein